MPARIVNPDDIRRLHADGLTDRQIAASVGAGVQTVRTARKRAGLTANNGRLDPVYREAMSLAVKAAQGRAGPVKATAVLAAKRERLASRYGLPPDLTPTEVVIVVTLSAGPMTTEALADACGRHPAGARPQYLRFHSDRCDGRNYLTQLRRRGLIESASTQGGGRVGARGKAVYFLTPHCLDLLASATTDDTRRTDSGRETSGEADGSQTQAPAGC